MSYFSFLVKTGKFTDISLQISLIWEKYRFFAIKTYRNTLNMQNIMLRG